MPFKKVDGWQLTVGGKQWKVIQEALGFRLRKKKICELCIAIWQHLFIWKDNFNRRSTRMNADRKAKKISIHGGTRKDTKKRSRIKFPYLFAHSCLFVDKSFLPLLLRLSASICGFQFFFSCCSPRWVICGCIFLDLTTAYRRIRSRSLSRVINFFPCLLPTCNDS